MANQWRQQLLPCYSGKPDHLMHFYHQWQTITGEHIIYICYGCNTLYEFDMSDNRLVARYPYQWGDTVIRARVKP